MPSRNLRFYQQLFSVCLLVLACLSLPGRWDRLASFGYLLLAVTMTIGLGRPLGGESQGSPAPRLFRACGLLTVAVGLLWSLTPLERRSSGVVLILLWSLFSVWSSLRLVSSLGAERRIERPVIIGALAGYLMAGLTSGLLCVALETVWPGSFIDLQQGGTPLLLNRETGVIMGQPVWNLSFARLTYFAFVSLTTVGYGDVVPATTQAQMLGVLIACVGTFYVTVVMGLLISRLIAQESDRP